MDGKGGWIDNVFVERLWRSVKYEDVYLKAYETVAEVRAGIGKYCDFYNSERRHQNLSRQTPDQVYLGDIQWPVMTDSWPLRRLQSNVIGPFVHFAISTDLLNRTAIDRTSRFLMQLELFWNFKHHLVVM